MTRALLIVPTTTYRAAEFLEAARRLDVDVVTASEERQALAEVMGDRFLHLPLADAAAAADAIVEFARHSPVDAIVAVDDQGSLAAATASARLGLVHNDPGAVAATRNKAEMRRRLATAGVRQPSFRVVGEATAPFADDVLTAAGALGYPVVIKPVGLSGSRGVIRADDDVDAVAAFERIGRMLTTMSGEPRTLVVERFVAGPEVAVEGLLTSGVLHALAIFDKPDPLDGPYFEETIYVTPSRHDPADRTAAIDAIADAARAIGLCEGPVHGEVRLGADGTSVLEVAARTIGGKCASALRFATATSLEEIVLRHALGEAPADLSQGASASGVMMLPIPASGTLVGVTGREEALGVTGVTRLEISIPPGREVLALPEASRYLGFLFAEGSTPAEVEASLRDGFSRLTVTIDPARSES